MKRILITYPLPEEILKKYRVMYGDKIQFDVADHPMDYEAVRKNAKYYDALFLIRGKADRQLLEENIQLQAIANFGVGYNNIDIVAATQYRITILNTPHQVTQTTAELAIALMLSAMRGVTRYDRKIRNKIWTAPLFSKQDLEVHQRVLGIIGMGRIGKMVVEKAAGLGMQIIYFNRHRLPVEEELRMRVQYRDFQTLLVESDCITLHIPFTQENYHLIDKAAFDKMKNSAYLINTSRGAVIDQKELIDALKTGKIKGAGLDVFEEEPNVPEELLELDNVVMTPHCGSNTWQTRIAMAQEALDGLCKLLSGECPENVVNPEVLR